MSDGITIFVEQEDQMHRIRLRAARAVIVGRSSPSRYLFMATVIVAIAIFIAGCGGGGSSTVVSSNGGFKQAGALYVGKGRCNDCHASTFAQFAGTVHGQNFHNLNGDDLISGHGGSCLPCHTQGFNNPSGYNDPKITPTTKLALEGIGCENCHGPGSKHAASQSKADITRVPPDKQTCWACHDPGYKMFDTPATIPTVNDATFQNTAPGSVGGPHHAQTIMLMGREAYNTPASPSPHSTLPNTCLNCHYRSTTISPINGKVDHSQANLLPDVSDKDTRAACVSCHGGGRLEDNPLQEGIKQMAIELGGADANGDPDANMAGGLLKAYATAKNITLTTNAAPTDPNVKAYKAARYNLGFVLSDKSLGVHNPGLTTKLLKDAKAMISN